MTVEIITIAAAHGEPLQTLAQAELVAGFGIVDDRHFGLGEEGPGQNLSLIEAEEIEAFNQRFGMNISLTSTRRNLVTRGVRLNDLVGKTFVIGSTRLKGIEFCEPCEQLGLRLATATLTMPEIVAAFVHRGGLRAAVLGSGTIRVGDAIVVQD